MEATAETHAFVLVYEKKLKQLFCDNFRKYFVNSTNLMYIEVLEIGLFPLLQIQS